MSAHPRTLRGIPAAALTAVLIACAHAANADVPAPAPETPTLPSAGMSSGAPHGPSPDTSAIAFPNPSPGTSPGAPPSEPIEDIRDIRGPKYLVPVWLIPAVIAAVVLVGLTAYGVWRWYRRRQRPRILSLSELTLQRLDELRSLMQPSSAREFTIAISDIVRGYIEQRFDVTATHRTTEEFLHDLLGTPKPSLARHRGLLEEFLQQCDLVKFGGMSLSIQRIEALHRSARAFVLETSKPDEVAPPQAGAAVTAAADTASTTRATAGAATTVSVATNPP